MVRAKFKVTSITHFNNDPHNYMADVNLTAVHGADNRTWSKWTPSGSLKMSITNPEAVARLELGKHYFLDFSPAPDKESDEAK